MDIGSAWANYVKRLGKLDSEATKKVGEYIGSIPGFSFTNPEDMNKLVGYAYGISAKYGEGAAALACEMYDAIGIASGQILPPAEPADLPDMDEVAKAVYGTAKTNNPKNVSRSVGRLVKRSGADTTLKNAIRDGAEFAWIPNGDTCAFCITLASRGWQKASAKALKNGHAEHIHANCDCTYGVRFNGKPKYKNYIPDEYLAQYEAAEGKNAKDKINALRRIKYQENRDIILAQKHALYERSRQIQYDNADNLTLRRGKEINAKRVAKSRFEIYVSEDATIKVQGLKNIEKAISESLENMEIPVNSTLPQIIILSEKEMGDTYASYNFVNNQLFVRDSMGDKRKTIANQKRMGFADPNDPTSTARHELIHWKDAELYRKNISDITTENYRDYLNYRDEQSRIKLEKMGINDNNVHQISRYAAEKYILKNDFDEAYTELRVKQRR